jgi:purine-binding chemotaxis protein CheW
MQMGIIVDSVQAVLDVKSSDIENAPSLGEEANTNYILAMVKAADRIQILLDIDRVLDQRNTDFMKRVFHQHN